MAASAMSASAAERTTRRELTAAGSDAFQAGSDNLPGVACVWIALEVGQTTIQFGLLGDGQRQPARLAATLSQRSSASWIRWAADSLPMSRSLECMRSVCLAEELAATDSENHGGLEKDLHRCLSSRCRR
jgi:hypothetical protein